MSKNNWDIYKSLIQRLAKAFGERLRTVVLFGSRARGKTEDYRDHDLFLVIDGLPANPLARQKEVRMVIWEVPLRINTVSKTPEEVARNLTPLLLEICVDGVCLYGGDYFEPYRKKALEALRQSGLKRKRVGKEWYWQFEKVPEEGWEIDWEGYHELS